MLSNDRHRVFKRVETDEEFRARLCEDPHRFVPDYLRGERLDSYVLDYYNTQRRIVEDTTDKPKR